MAGDVRPRRQAIRIKPEGKGSPHRAAIQRELRSSRFRFVGKEFEYLGSEPTELAAGALGNRIENVEFLEKTQGTQRGRFAHAEFGSTMRVSRNGRWNAMSTSALAAPRVSACTLARYCSRRSMRPSERLIASVVWVSTPLRKNLSHDSKSPLSRTPCRVS